MRQTCLTEIGHVCCTLPDGREWLLVPSLAAMVRVGSPTEIVETFHELHSAKFERARDAAVRVIGACAADDDASELIGYYACAPLGVEHAPEGERPVRVDGALPAAEMVLVARHLMRHGVAGKSRPGGRGAFATEFNAAEHVAGAMVHLGISRDEALSLTMTELQGLIEAKYPDAKQAQPLGRDEYRTQMDALKKKRKESLGV